MKQETLKIYFINDFMEKCSVIGEVILQVFQPLASRHKYINCYLFYLFLDQPEKSTIILIQVLHYSMLAINNVGKNIT